MSDNTNNRRGKKSPIVGVPSPEQDSRVPTNESVREKILTSGRRRTNQPVIKIRDTGDDNYMHVVKERHERRKMLDDESKRGLPDNLIYNPKEPINSMELFKDEKGLSKRTNRNPDEKPITEA